MRAAVRSSQGFTLVELLLVMTIMVTALAISAPLLANFFRGRTLDSEMRRLLALTHAGQSRAISEGVPMRLWLDPQQNAYGLEEDPGWVDHDPKAERFSFDQSLRVAVIPSNSTRSSSSPKGAAAAPSRASVTGMPELRFLPDGSFEETNPRALRVYDRNGLSLWLTLARNRMHYEIRNDFKP
jgi:prepilin-type N-terminal cleavage/methylation domain-containing protein